MRKFAPFPVSALALLFFANCPNFGHGRYVNDGGVHRENDRLYQADSLKSVLQYYKTQNQGNPLALDSVETESIEVNAENPNQLAYRIDIDSKSGVTEISTVLSSEEDDENDSEISVDTTNAPASVDDPEEAEIETTTLFPDEKMEEFGLINKTTQVNNKTPAEDPASALHNLANDKEDQIQYQYQPQNQYQYHPQHQYQHHPQHQDEDQDDESDEEDEASLSDEEENMITEEKQPGLETSSKPESSTAQVSSAPVASLVSDTTSVFNSHSTVPSDNVVIASEAPSVAQTLPVLNDASDTVVSSPVTILEEAPSAPETLAHSVSETPSISETPAVTNIPSAPSTLSPVETSSVPETPSDPVAPIVADAPSVVDFPAIPEVASVPVAPIVADTPSVVRFPSKPKVPSVPKTPIAPSVVQPPAIPQIYIPKNTTLLHLLTVAANLPYVPPASMTASVPPVIISHLPSIPEASSTSGSIATEAPEVVDVTTPAPVTTTVSEASTTQKVETTTPAPLETACTEGQWRRRDACNLCVCINGNFLCSQAACAPKTTAAGVKNSVKKPAGATEVELGISNSVGSSASYSLNHGPGPSDSFLGLDVLADEMDTLTTVPTTTTTTTTTPKPECYSGATKAVDCNMCVCSPREKWACTKRSCIALTLREKASYSDGSFLSKTQTLLENHNMDEDCSEGEINRWGCNTCVCFHNSWSCTNEKCPTTTPAPRIADTEEACQIEHDIKTVDCNTCHCQRGIWVCGRNDCKNIGQRYDLQSSRTKFRFRSSSKN